MRFPVLTTVLTTISSSPRCTGVLCWRSPCHSESAASPSIRRSNGWLAGGADGGSTSPNIYWPLIAERLSRDLKLR